MTYQYSSTQVVPFTGGVNQPTPNLPDGIADENAQLVFVDASNPLPNVQGVAPAPGYYVLVANYYQPGPGIVYKHVVK